MSTQTQYKATFPCCPSEARRARKALAAFAKGWLCGTEATDFESAVGEALANAINHGKCKSLMIDCYFARRELVAIIEQQNGVPFDPPAKSQPPAEGAVGGYGLFIMRSVLDELEFAENGRRVRLVKRAAAG